MATRPKDHRVSLAPVWAPDKHTSKLLGTKARHIVGWTAKCEVCEWKTAGVTWSDARRFGHSHRVNTNEANGRTTV